jgi:hypothetical protein
VIKTVIYEYKEVNPENPTEPYLELSGQEWTKQGPVSVVINKLVASHEEHGAWKSSIFPYVYCPGCKLAFRLVEVQR